jgi:hypothetical protein
MTRRERFSDGVRRHPAAQPATVTRAATASTLLGACVDTVRTVTVVAVPGFARFSRVTVTVTVTDRPAASVSVR